MKMVRILQIKAGDERQKVHNCTHPYTALQRGCGNIASSLYYSSLQLRLVGLLQLYASFFLNLHFRVTMQMSQTECMLSNSPS